MDVELEAEMARQMKHKKFTKPLMSLFMKAIIWICFW